MEHQGIFKIAEPCHENWNQMTPETQGRFCAACQRCVVDFTQKSAAEMKTIYEQANGDVCGRVRISQVQAPRPAVRSLPSRMRMGALKGIQIFALALMLVFSGLMPTQAKAQKELMGKVAYVPEKHATSEVSGRVLLESGRPAVGATVTLETDGNALAVTQTDAKGMYQFHQVRNGEYVLQAVLAGEGDGYQLIKVTGRPLQREDIRLHEPVIMGGLRYVPDEPIEPIDIEEVPQVKEVVAPIEIEEVPMIQNIDDLQPIAPTTDCSECLDSHHPIDLLTDLDVVPAPEKTFLDPAAPIQVSDFSLWVYPNPTSDQVHLVFDKAGADKLEVTVFDIGGKPVYAGVWLRLIEASKVIDLQGQPAGIYLLRLQAGDTVVQHQIIKI